MSHEESLLVKLLEEEDTARKAFSQLVESYQEKVYFIIRRLLIDHEDTNDAVQMTFIKVWQKRSSFKGKSSIMTWIYRIATNEALQSLRKKQRRGLGQVDLEMALQQAMNSNQLSGTEIELRLEKALVRLPDKQKLVFNLKYFEDLSYEDISTITETSVGALKASYHLAVKKIEDYMNAYGEG